MPSLTNWEIFFDLYEVFLRFFKKIFSTTFQEQKKPLSHHKDVIGAEYEVFLRFFKKIFSTTFQEQKKPLSHHKDVIGAEIEKAR